MEQLNEISSKKLESGKIDTEHVKAYNMHLFPVKARVLVDKAGVGFEVVKIALLE